MSERERLARSMLGWTYGGFSVDLSVRIARPAAVRSPAGGPTASSRTREAFAPYIARPPIPRSKTLVAEHGASVLDSQEDNPYFKTTERLSPALEFIVQVLRHLYDARAHPVRRCGSYSSRSRETGIRTPHLVRLAPPGRRRSKRGRAT